MKTLCILISFLLLLSCNKNDTTTLLKRDLTIRAGQTGDSVSYSDLTPDIIVKYADVSCKNFYGEDSIDLNKDKAFDIKIIYQVVTPDLDYSCCPGGDCFPSGYQLIELKGLNEKYQIAIDSAKIIHKFNANDIISRNYNWDNSKTVYFANSLFPAWINKWNDTENKYIGIRILDKDTLYGWIRISYKDTIVVKDYAFKKIN